MTVTPRDIEKLKAIGYKVDTAIHGFMWCDPIDIWRPFPWEPVIKTEAEAWAAAKKNALSSKNMKATMADKVRWLREHGPLWSSVHIETEFGSDGPTGWATAEQKAVENGKVVSCIQSGGPSDEAAVDALFWKVP